MKVLEVYTPAQIRACGQMLELFFAQGRRLEEFLELVAVAKAQSTHPMMSKYRLVFETSVNGDSSNEEILNSFSYETLRSWLKIEKLFSSRTIRLPEVRSAAKRLRKAALSDTRFGWSRP